MKKYLFAIAAGILPVLAISNTANAQSLNNVIVDNIRPIKINHSVFPEPKSTSIADLSTVNSKALKDFKKSYKKASNETWTKIDDGFTATFNADASRSVIYYNNKGHWTGSLKSYPENQLDKSVRALVKSTYYDFKINLVEEIETNETAGVPTYIVYMEDKNNVKLIRVSNGEMDVYQEFVKQ
jgi:hypothetical protein